MASDALRAHWRCLNALGTLSVPLDFYEGESRDEWGLEPIGRLLRSCEVFEEACRGRHAELSQRLREIGERLGETTTALEYEEPPLWRALYELCHEEPPPGEARLLVFTGRARKQLFLLAMLAYWNITREDLAQMRIWAASLDDLRRWARRSVDEVVPEDAVLDAPRLDLVWRPMLVGLPGSQVTPKLAPVLTQKNVDVLLYPHQRSALTRRMREWKLVLDLDPPSICRHSGGWVVNVLLASLLLLEADWGRGRHRTSSLAVVVRGRRTWRCPCGSRKAKPSQSRAC